VASSGRPMASSSSMLPVWCHFGGGARGVSWCWLRH
jgi:hypothetical protein